MRSLEGTSFSEIPLLSFGLPFNTATEYTILDFYTFDASFLFDIILTNVLSLNNAAVLMPSSSSPEQSSGPDPGSVLCDKCKNSVLEPSQSTENVSLPGKLQQALKDWLLSPQLWPVGYLIRSPYSPLRVEQELPKREWRNAFEDLLALESGGDMISDESRKQEKDIAANLSWERANYCINKINKWNIHDAPDLDLMQRALDTAKSPAYSADPLFISWVEDTLKQRKEKVWYRIALAEAYKAQEETRREWSASRHKERGQWVASLITSGALRGWTSVLKDSEDGDVISLSREKNSENSENSESSDGITISELELKEYFEDGKPLHTGTPRAPLYRVLRQPPATPVDDDQEVDDFSVSHKPPPAETIMWRMTPERPCFYGQRMAAERITLPNGKMATKVVMRNWLTNGDVEEKVMVEEPGKVLQEVEKARASISDRRFGFDAPI